MHLKTKDKALLRVKRWVLQKPLPVLVMVKWEKVLGMLRTGLKEDQQTEDQPDLREQKKMKKTLKGNSSKKKK